MLPSKNAQWLKIGGWCSVWEGDYLYNLAAGLDVGARIVEIGTYKGKSAVALGLGCMESGAHLITIDHYKGNTEHKSPPTEEEANENIAKFGLAGFVDIWNMESSLAMDRIFNVRMAYIDGNHDYNSVFGDFLCVWPRLRREADLLFHDYHHTWASVVKCVDDIVKRWPLEKVNQVDSIAHFRKIAV